MSDRAVWCEAETLRSEVCAGGAVCGWDDTEDCAARGARCGWVNDQVGYFCR